MKKIARVLALALALLMVIALFAACGATSDEKETKKETTKDTTEQSSETEKGNETSAEPGDETESEKPAETETEGEPVYPEEDPELAFINWNDTDKYTLADGAFTATSGSKFLDGSDTTRVRTTSMVDAKVTVEYTFTNKDLRNAVVGVLVCSQRMGTTVEVSTDNENWTSLLELDPEDTRLPYDYIIPGTAVMAPCDANWNIQIYKIGDVLTDAKTQKAYVRFGTKSVTAGVDYVGGGNDNTGFDSQIGVWFCSDPEFILAEIHEPEEPELTFINWNDEDKYTLTGGAFTATSGSKFLDGSDTTRVRTVGNTEAYVNVEYTFTNKDLENAVVGVLLCCIRMGTTVEVSTDNENWTSLIVLDPEDTRLPYDYMIAGTKVMDPCDQNWNILIYNIGDVLTAAKSQTAYIRLGTQSVTPDVDFVKSGNDNTGCDSQIGIWFCSDVETLLAAYPDAE